MEEMSGSRLKKFREDKKLSQRELAQRTGIQQAILSRLETGKMSLLSPHVPSLSRVLGIPPARLLGVVSNVTPASMGARRIPILSYDQINKFTIATLVSEEVKEFTLSDASHSLASFAVNVLDDSMAPEFSAGDLVVIDPEISIRPGDFIVATDSEGQAFFRQYRDLGLSDDGNPCFELVPLNKLYAAISSTRKQMTIAGVMLEHRKYRK